MWGPSATVHVEDAVDILHQVVLKDLDTLQEYLLSVLLCPGLDHGV